MKHPNEAFISLNIHSDLLNNAAVAKKLGLKPKNYYDKLSGRGGSKPFTAAELINIENIIKTDLNL